MFFALLPPAGRVRAVRGRQELQAHEAVLEIHCEIQEGAELAKIIDNTQRKGYIVFQGKDLFLLYQTASAALQRLQLEYEDGSTWSPILHKLPENPQ